MPRPGAIHHQGRIIYKNTRFSDAKAARIETACGRRLDYYEWHDRCETLPARVTCLACRRALVKAGRGHEL